MREYTDLEMEVIAFEDADVITASRDDITLYEKE